MHQFGHDHDLRPFQRRFVTAALRPGVDTAALSIPRGNGKSWLAAHILTRCLTPGDPLNVPAAEYLLAAASIEQARLVYRFVRDALEPAGDYRFLDSAMRIGVTHKPTKTKLRVLSSNAKTAFGIVGCPLIVCDEPGSWETIGGQLMHDAIATAMGKPGSPMRTVYIGTLAPARAGWWHDLIDAGSRGSTYIQALRGRRERWDSYHEIRRCNPLANIDARFRAKLLEERSEARADSRLKARFLSYRLNVPSADESDVLLTTDDWERMTARPVPEPAGRAIVGIDLGAGRAWSAAVAVWESGRVEALAVAPGIPSLADQETRDRVPAGTYQALQERGSLRLAAGLRVQPPAAVWAMVLGLWGIPAAVVCDRFRLAELADAVQGAAPLEPRVSRWSEASADIRALRKLAKDGPWCIDPASRLLIAASLEAAVVKSDDQGSTRLVKSANNTSRDDVAAAMVLAAGAFERTSRRPVNAGASYVVV